jgi:hypothetical protein
MLVAIKHNLAIEPWFVPEPAPLATALPRMFDPPNKAPEPTAGSVTLRAFVRVIELKPQNPSRHAARSAPVPAVAHL